MYTAQEGERRGSLRYQASLRLVMQQPSPSGTGVSSVSIIRGETQNISNGGFCARLDQSCEESILLRCEIQLADCPVAIPTLARVRWVKDDNHECLAGVEFLLH